MKKNKTLKTLSLIGVSESEIPEFLKENLHEVMTGAGFSSTLEIGVLIREDLTLIKELIEHLEPLKVVTSKKELFKKRLEKGDNHIGFTHINTFYEDNVFIVLYAVPAKFIFGLKKG